jgi:hypothetical protein
LSLIDEALKRAREQAARQDAAKRDAQYRQVPAWAPPSRRSVSPAVIGGVIAFCAAAGLGVGLYLGRPHKPAEPEAAMAAMTAASPTPADSPAEPAGPLPARVEESPAAPAEATPQLPDETRTEARTETRTTPEPAAETPAAPEAPAAPATPAPVTVPVDTSPTPEPTATPPEPAPAPEVRNYVREMPLPDGGSLRLDGVAFSSSQPVAVINGRVVGKGEAIEGFTVTLIESKHVVLSRAGLTVHLTLP